MCSVCVGVCVFDKPVGNLTGDECSNQDPNIVDGGGQWRFVGFVTHQVPLRHANTTQQQMIACGTC